MNPTNQPFIRKTLAWIVLAGTTGLGAPSAFAESEANNTSATADVLALNFATGATTTGKLRAGNTTPTPRDIDFFKFTNVHGYATIDVKISATGIYHLEHLSYEVLTTGLTPIFPGSPHTIINGPDTKTITSPNRGTSFFIKVFDDGNLTALSGEGSYTIEVTGTGGVDPLPAYRAKVAACKRLQLAYQKARAKARKTGAKSDRDRAAALARQLAACKRQVAALKAQAGL